MYILVSEEVILNYLNGHNDIHVMLLDASKAFDCVNYLTLFRRLLVKGLCPLVCRVLLYMHIFQCVQVRWNTHLSDPFSVSNGVKQGGILSPVLFSIDSDVLLCALRDSGVGCYLGHQFAGALAYADDVVILAPTRSALTSMLVIADQCARALDLKFNGAKSQYVRYCSGHQGSDDDFIRFCGVEVKRSCEGLHLGNLLGSRSRRDAVHRATLDLNCRSNVLLSRFSFCSPEVRYKLFKAQCVVAYGSPLWDFDSDFVKEYFVSWRRNVRRIWGLPSGTHTRLFSGICRDRSIDHQLLSRSVKFVRNASDSTNRLLKSSISHALRGSGSCMSNTIAKICFDFGVDRAWMSSYTGPLPDIDPPISSTANTIRDKNTRCFNGQSTRSHWKKPRFNSPWFMTGFSLSMKSLMIERPE